MSQTLFPSNGHLRTASSGQTPSASVPSTPTGMFPGFAVALPSTKERVIAFYKKYNPAKLADVDNIMKVYAGKDDELLNALQAKYGPEDNPQVVHAVQQQQVLRQQLARDPQLTAQQQQQQQQQVPLANATNPAANNSPTIVASSFQQRLHALLSRHEPAKLHLIPQMVVAFRGNEENLLRGLERKYLSGGGGHAGSATGSSASTPNGQNPPSVFPTAGKPQQQPMHSSPPRTSQPTPQLFPGQTSPLAPQKKKGFQLFPGQSSPTTPLQQQHAPVTFVTTTPTLSVARPPLQAATPASSNVSTLTASKKAEPEEKISLTKRRELNLNPKLAELVVSDSDDSSAGSPVKKNAVRPPAQTEGKKIIVRPLTPTVQLGAPGLSPFAKAQSTTSSAVQSPSARQVPTLPMAPPVQASPIKSTTQTAGATLSHGQTPIHPPVVAAQQGLQQSAPPAVVPPPPQRDAEMREQQVQQHHQRQPHPLLAEEDYDPQVSPRTDISAESHAPQKALVERGQQLQSNELFNKQPRATSHGQQVQRTDHLPAQQPPMSAAVVEPLTERRSNERSIVVAPVLVIGNRSGSAPHQRNPSPQSVSVSPLRQALSSKGASTSELAHHHTSGSRFERRRSDNSVVSLSVGADLQEDGARSAATGSHGRMSPVSDIHSDGGRIAQHHSTTERRTDGIVQVIRSTSFEVQETFQRHQHGGNALRRDSGHSDRNQVSVSPLSPNMSVAHDVGTSRVPAKRSSQPQTLIHPHQQTSENVGCEHTRKNRSASVPKRPPASDDQHRPLWVNPGAKGTLSTVYTRGRDDEDERHRSASAQAAFSDSILKVYRRPSPSTFVNTQDLRSKSMRVTADSPQKLAATIAPSSIPAVQRSPPRRRSSLTTTPNRVAAMAPSSSNAIPNTSRMSSPNVKMTTQRGKDASRREHLQPPSRKSSPNTSAITERPDVSHADASDVGEEIVYDLRKDFRPNISKPPPLEDVLGRRVVSPPRSHVPPPSSSSAHQRVQSNATSGGEGMTGSSSTSRPVTPRSATVTSTERRSKTPPVRKVVEVEHAPAIPPFQMYSSFGSAASKGGRPSAWAKAPTKIGLFDVSPKRGRHHTITVGPSGAVGPTHDPLTSVVVDPETGLSTLIKYDAYGHRIKLIRDVPMDPEAIEAQRKLDNRLAMPRPIYIRKGEHH